MLTEDAGGDDPGEYGKIATFTIGPSGFLAEVEDPETWTPDDWSNLILAAVRVAQKHGGRLPTVDTDILDVLRMQAEQDVG